MKTAKNRILNSQTTYSLMYSLRFDKNVHITKHAQKRMIERDISMDLLYDLIETGHTRYKDEQHAWIAKYYPQRTDVNLRCLND